MNLLKDNIVSLCNELQPLEIFIECSIKKDCIPNAGQSLEELIKSYDTHQDGYLYFYRWSDDNTGFTELAKIYFCDHKIEKVTIYYGDDDHKEQDLKKVLEKFNLMPSVQPKSNN